MNLKRGLSAFGALLLTLLGAAAVVLGEADDSPGLQGIGVLLVIAALLIVRKSVQPDDPSAGA